MKLSLAFCFSVPAFLPTLGLAQGADLPGVRRLESPFVCAQHDGRTGLATLLYADDAYRELKSIHDADETLALSGFRLPGGEELELVLRPVSAMADGARAVVMGEQGEVGRLSPSIALFSGYASGGGGIAFFGISPDMFHGYVTVGDALYVISSGPSPIPGQALLARSDEFPASGAGSEWCRTIERMVPQPRNGTAGIGGSPIVREAWCFIEADDQFTANLGGAQASADYSNLLLTATHEIYRRDLGVAMVIPDGYLRVWTTTPPWGVTDIVNLWNYWNSSGNPLRDIPRASVHALTYPVFGGVAFLDALCNNEESYAVTTAYGHFPYPIEHTNDDNWDLLVIAHEYGHNFGSLHTFDYDPPIECQDGSGPDSGTIMSYCHQVHGVGGVGMRFHARVQEVIREFMDEVDCLTDIPFELGDYDYDGTLGADDLAALDACLSQGFESSGCLESFDMDGDGALTPCDRTILEQLVNGPGSLFCFGDSACPCGNDGGPCAGCANSSGAGASLTGTGTRSIAADDMVLIATETAPNQNGLFFMGTGQGSLALGDGLRCVTGQLFRFPIQNSGPGGTMTLGPGTVAYSLANFQSAGQISVGETWNFQAWHRDPMGPCASAHNLSSAYSVTFTP